MPMTNDPTTGEIVRALGNPETLDQESLYYWSKVAADRLESQEKTIAALTARAEKAELERDALKLEFATIEEDGLCSVCKFESSIPLLRCMEDCCFKHRGLSSLSVDGVSGDGNEWRGLPQDGEGKK